MKKLLSRKYAMWMLAVVLGMSVGVLFYVGGSEKSSVVSDDDARKFYASYIEDMNAYGLKDPEKLMVEYFSDSLKAGMDVSSVKADFGSMVESGVRYGGKVVSTDRTRGDGQVEVAVSEWKEDHGKQVDESTVFLGVYVVGREDGRLVFSSIAANDVTDDSSSKDGK